MELIAHLVPISQGTCLSRNAHTQRAYYPELMWAEGLPRDTHADLATMHPNVFVGIEGRNRLHRRSSLRDGTGIRTPQHYRFFRHRNSNTAEHDKEKNGRISPMANELCQVWH